MALFMLLLYSITIKKAGYIVNKYVSYWQHLTYYESFTYYHIVNVLHMKANGPGRCDENSNNNKKK